MLKTLARPYAKALFELALEENTLADWHVRLGSLARFFQEPELKEKASSRHISAEAWVNFLVDLAPKSLSDEKVHRFLKLLAEKRRLSLLPLVHHCFLSLVRERAGEKVFQLRVGSPMDKSTVASWETFLSQASHSHARVETILDKTMVAGLDISGEGHRLDQSLSGILMQLRRRLKSA